MDEVEVVRELEELFLSPPRGHHHDVVGQTRCIMMHQREVGLLAVPQHAERFATPRVAPCEVTSPSEPDQPPDSRLHTESDVNDESASQAACATDQVSIADLPIELLPLVLTTLTGPDLLFCRAVCSGWRRLASRDALWIPLIEGLKSDAEWEDSPSYTKHIAARLADGHPARLSFWEAVRIGRAPSEARVRSAFVARNTLQSYVASAEPSAPRIRSYHLAPVLRSLFGVEPSDADLVDLAEILDTDALGWVICDDFVQWMLTEPDCWLLDRRDPDGKDPDGRDPPMVAG